MLSYAVNDIGLGNHEFMEGDDFDMHLDDMNKIRVSGAKKSEFGKAREDLEAILNSGYGVNADVVKKLIGKVPRK